MSVTNDDIRDVKADLVELLKQEVQLDAASVPMDESDIDFANYDAGLSYPGVYVQAESTTVPGAGATGYTGMDAGSGGPTQDPVTTVQVDCWGGDVNTDRLEEAGVYPDVLANELGWLVWQAVRANASGWKDYSSIGVAEPDEANDTESSPTRYRRIVPVAMAYHVGPQ